MKRWLGVGVLLAVAFGTGCGGGGGSTTQSPAPTATLTVSGGASASVIPAQSVTLQWSCTNATSATASAVPPENDWTGTRPTSGTASVTPGGIGGFIYSIQCSGTNGMAPASVLVTVNLPPTVSIGPSPATVVLGGTQLFPLTITGSPVPTTICVSMLLGNIPISGSTATYTVPTAVQTAWADTLTCTAVNSAGQAQAPTSITLQYPVPVLTSLFPASSEAIFLANNAVIGNVPLTGSGLSVVGTCDMNPDDSVLIGAQSVNWNQSNLTFDFGFNVGSGRTPWDPGFYGLFCADPAGHGGGTSNVLNFAFLGNQNTVALSSTDAFQADQGSFTIWKFKLADSSADGNFTINATGIGYDNGANTAVVSEANDLVLAMPTQAGTNTNSPPMGVDARNGVACYAEDQINEAGCFLVSTNSNPTSTFIPVAGTPWDVAMTSFGGTLSAVTLSVGSPALTTEGVSTSSGLALTQTGTFPIANLTPQSQWPFLQGGAQLQVFSSGPNQGDIAVLSQADTTLVRVHATVNSNGTITMAESNRVKLSGIPFRIGRNEADGSVVVAVADVTDALTKFVKVSANGTVTNLSSTVPFLATGFQVSPDGTKLYCANRGTFQEVANQ